MFRSSRKVCQSCRFSSKETMKLFSYVVQHDLGVAPCVSKDYCTLAKCMFSKSRIPNVVELAQVGDWIIGTGGVNRNTSTGHGTVVYAMRVDEKLTFPAYFQDKRFRGRPDNDDPKQGDRFALISKHFFYFGRSAIEIEETILQKLNHPLEKKGPRFRSDFDEPFIKELTQWLESQWKVGIHGLPCASPKQPLIQIGVQSRRKRK